MNSFKDYVNIQESIAGDKAKKMGLTHMGFGNWGRDGVVLYRQSFANLLPVKQKAKPAAVKEKPQEPKVYEDENLMFLPSAFDRDHFENVKKTTNEDAPCLLLQSVHTISTQLGIHPNKILDKFDPAGREFHGHTLAEIYDGINGLEIDGKIINLDIDVIENIDDALAVVRKGKPVICMVQTFGPLVLGMSKHADDEFKNTGVVKLKKRREDKTGSYHALMLAGLDKAADHVIFRDSEHNYSFKGFVKVGYSNIKNTPSLISRYIELTANWK